MPQKNNVPVQGDGIVESILQQAIDMKTSDIHISPERTGLTVRLRVDGDLYSLTGLDGYVIDEIISKIKVLADINITEKRLAQDGHFEFSYGDKTYNFRVSTTPTIYGEAAVIRMLNKEGIVVDLSDLGFNEEQLETVNKIIHNQFGMVLVTGPTGSGKSTLLYSFLNKLNRPERNILTLEDPVEYQMSNIRQMQINESIGWDFAKGMRAVVRQDPDVIMLGEIRDEQTASMAFQASLTGRLVFSTFHTFDVPGMVMRLREMQIPRSIIAHSITGVISSRLVKKVCQSCAADFTPSDVDLNKLGIAPGKYTFKKGKGCEVCRQSGYKGRTGVFEVVYFDDEIRNNIMQERPDIPLSQVLAKKNFTSLKQNGIRLITEGKTTTEEIARVLGL